MPVLKDTLRTGSDVEKWTILSMIQKNLRWQETSEEVLEIIDDPNVPDKVLGRAIAVAAVLDVQEAGESIRAKILGSKNPDIREVAIRALGRLRYKDSLNDLKDALRDPSIRVSLAAADSLGKMGDPYGYNIAEKYLDHSDWFIRKLAVQALGNIGTDTAVNRLNLHLDSESSPMAKAETKISINKITMKEMVKDKAFDHLKKLLDSEDRFVSRWAYKHIFENYPEKRTGLFQKRLQSNSKKVREEAIIHLLMSEEYPAKGKRQ